VVRAADITYKLAPRLNAAGRMGDPADSLRLLEADSMTDAAALARSLMVLAALTGIGWLFWTSWISLRARASGSSARSPVSSRSCSA